MKKNLDNSAENREKTHFFEHYVALGREKSTFGISVFALACAWVVVIFATRMTLLSVVGAVIACVISLFIFLGVLVKNKLSAWLFAAYAVEIGGITLFYMIFGIQGALGNIGDNLLLASPSMIILGLLLCTVKYWKISAQKIVAAACSFVLMGVAVLYVLSMNLSIKPQVESLQEGHDSYLAALRNSNTDISNSPNVLLIVMDDLGYADLSSYCYRTDGQNIINTPNIDRIGELGVTFENFYASAPVCTPSRFSIFTGRYATRGYCDNVIYPSDTDFSPFSTTRYFNTFEFPNGVEGLLGDEITIAEAMQAVGYSTGCVGKWNLGDTEQYIPTNQGFDYFYGSYYVNDMTPYNIVENDVEVISHYDVNQDESNRLFTDKLKDYISGALDNNDKFFAAYTTPWPHYPVHAGEDYQGTSSAGTYGDCIEEFDTMLGEIYSLLEERGVFDDTLIIFTSDNGPGREGATGALRGRKNTTFDGGQKVPLMMCWTGAGGFAHSDTLVTSSTMNTDLFPTILSFCGMNSLPTDRIIDGVDISGLVRGTLSSDTIVHPILYHMKRGRVQAVSMSFAENGKNVTYKYYKHVQTENSAFFDQYYNNYLFNLTNDPAEAYNTAMNDEEHAAILAATLKEATASFKANRRGIL